MRADMIEAIRGLLGEPPPNAYYVSSDGDFDESHVFCHEHALAVAWWVRREEMAEAWVSPIWEETDRVETCDFGSCGIVVVGGGLTTNGIDSALGVTESDPFTCNVNLGELVLAADSMAPDDRRWSIWEHHAKRHLVNAARREARRKAA